MLFHVGILEVVQRMAFGGIIGGSNTQSASQRLPLRSVCTSAAIDDSEWKAPTVLASPKCARMPWKISSMSE